MRRVSKAVIGAAITVIASASLVAASATTYSGSHGLTLTTTGLARYPGYCGNARYRITGNYRSAPYWDVEVTVTDPRGQWDGGGYYYSGADLPTIQDTVYLCTDIDIPGSYRVAVVVEEDNSDYILQAKYSLTGHFTFTRIPRATPRLSVTRAKSGRPSWKITGRLTRAGKPWAAHRVQIQAKAYGSLVQGRAREDDEQERRRDLDLHPHREERREDPAPAQQRRQQHHPAHPLAQFPRHEEISRRSARTAPPERSRPCKGGARTAGSSKQCTVVANQWISSP